MSIVEWFARSRRDWRRILASVSTARGNLDAAGQRFRCVAATDGLPLLHLPTPLTALYELAQTPYPVRYLAVPGWHLTYFANFHGANDSEHVHHVEPAANDAAPN
jgi:hypothetical protein